MDDYLPSEVARLVLGYLKEVNCMKSWNTFLEESSSLREYYLLYSNGKIYSTNVDEKSLSEILSFYRNLKKYGEKIVNEIKRCEKEYSCDPDTEKGILEEIVNMVSLAFQKYLSSNNENIMGTPTPDGTVGIIYSESKAKINDLSENMETNCSSVIHENNDETLPNISGVYSLSNVNSSSLPFFQNLIDFNIAEGETLKDECLENNKVLNMEKSDCNPKDSCSVMNNESQVYYVTNKGSFVNNNNSINNPLLENCGDNFIIVPGSCASVEAKTASDTEMSPKNILENVNKLEVPILSNSYNMASSGEMVTNLNNENHLVKENIGCSNDNSSEKSLSCKNSEIDANNNLEFNRLSYNNQNVFGGIFNYENKLGCLNNEIGPAIAFNPHQLATMNTLPISTIPTCVLAGDILMQSTIPYNYVMNTSCSGLSLPITDTSSNIQNMNATTSDTLKYGGTMLTLSTPLLGNILALPNGQPVITNTIGEKDLKKADESSEKKSKKKKDKKPTDKSKKIKSNELKSSEKQNYSKCSKRKFLCLLPCTPEKSKEVAVATTSVCNTAISEVAANTLKLFSLITGQNEVCNRPVSTAEHGIQNESQVISTKNKSINKIDKSKGNVVQSCYQKGNLNKSDTLKSNNITGQNEDCNRLVSTADPKIQNESQVISTKNKSINEIDKSKENVVQSCYQKGNLNKSDTLKSNNITGQNEDCNRLVSTADPKIQNESQVISTKNKSINEIDKSKENVVQSCFQKGNLNKSDTLKSNNITGQNEDCNRLVSTADPEIQNESQVISTKNKSINKIDKFKGNVIQSYYQKGNLNKSDKSDLKSNNKSKKSQKQTIRNVNDVANNDVLANNKLKCNVSFSNHQTCDIKQSQASSSKVESQENTMVNFNDKIKTYLKQKKVPQNSKEVNSLEKLTNAKQVKKILPKSNEGIIQDKNDTTSQKGKKCTRSKTKSQKENIVSEKGSLSICKKDFPKECSHREVPIYSFSNHQTCDIKQSQASSSKVESQENTMVNFNDKIKTYLKQKKVPQNSKEVNSLEKLTNAKQVKKILPKSNEGIIQDKNDTTSQKGKKCTRSKTKSQKENIVSEKGSLSICKKDFPKECSHREVPIYSFSNHQTCDIKQSQASSSKVESQENTMVKFNDKIKTYLKQKKVPQNSKEVNSLEKLTNAKQVKKILPKNNERFIQDKNDTTSQKKKKCTRSKTKSQKENIVSKKGSLSTCKKEFPKKCSHREVAIYSIKDNCKNSKSKKFSSKDQIRSDVNNKHLKKNHKYKNLKSFCKSSNSIIQEEKKTNKHSSLNFLSDLNSVLEDQHSKTVFRTTEEDCSLKQITTSEIKGIPNDHESTRLSTVVNSAESLLQNESDNASNKYHTGIFTSHNADIVTETESMVQNYPMLICDEKKSKFENLSNIIEKENDVPLMTDGKKDVWHSTPNTFIENKKTAKKIKLSKYSKTKNENKKTSRKIELSKYSKTKNENKKTSRKIELSKYSKTKNKNKKTSRKIELSKYSKTKNKNKKTSRKIELSKYSKTKNGNKKLFPSSLIINKPVSSYSSPSSDDRNSKIITNLPISQAIKSLSFHNSAESFLVSGDNWCSNHADTCDVSESFSNIDHTYNDTRKKRKLGNSYDIDDRLELNVSDNQFSNCSSLSITKKPNCNESDNMYTDNKLQSVPCVMLSKLDEHKIYSLTHTVDHNKKEKFSENKNNFEQISKTISEENIQTFSQSSNESFISCSLKLSIQNFNNNCDSNLKNTVDTSEEKSGDKANEKYLAFASCEKQLVISQSSDESHSSKNVCSNDIAVSSEKETFENSTVSSEKEVKTAIKVVSSQWDIILSAIEKYGCDYILSKINDYLNC